MQENDNMYISSRGILKSCDYYSLTPHSSIKRLYNYPDIKVLDTIKTPTIYVCSSAIPHFISVMLPLIKNEFILVSGDCDETIPDEILNGDNLKQLLNNTKLKHWFSQNMTLEHPKITKMPIGLDYHTLQTRPLWGPITKCQDQEKILTMVKSKSTPFWERSSLCYANFHFSMNTKLGYDRKDAYQNIDKKLVYYEENKVSRIITWNKQKEYAFVICPHGGGLDCHRNWEALCLGCIPIVKTSKIDNLYDNLPVLIVDDWKNINTELLENTINKFKVKFQNNEFEIEKLKLKYWTDIIDGYK
jgi:hypothetical protein